MQKGFSTIITLTTALCMLAILTAVIWYYFEFRQAQNNYTTVTRQLQETEKVSVDQTNIQIPNNWQQYTDVGINFTFAYPQSAEVYRMEENINILLNATQSTTLTLTSLPLNGRRITELVEQKREEMEVERGVQIDTVEELEIGDKIGYKIKTEAAASREKIYLPRGTDMYYEATINFDSDQNQQDWQTINRTLTTLKER